MPDEDDPDAGQIITLAVLKEHIDWDDDDRHDGELRFFIRAAAATVQDMVGPVVPRTVSEVHSPRRCAELALRQIPVITLDAVTPVGPGGVAVDPTLVDVEEDTGICRLPGGGCFTGPIRVTYTAGRSPVPEAIELGTAIIVDRLWDTQRGVRPGMGDDEMVSTPMGFLVPRRAAELMRAYTRAGVLA